MWRGLWFVCKRKVLFNINWKRVQPHSFDAEVTDGYVKYKLKRNTYMYNVIMNMLSFSTHLSCECFIFVVDKNPPQSPTRHKEPKGK